MLPVIALVGRPNVGKSTLFNRLTRTRDALVADFAGLTRDRKYAEAELDQRRVILVDTGGLSGEEEGIDAAMASQSWQAVDEADLVLFLVDARAGITAADQQIAQRLRTSTKPVILVANKVDGQDPDVARAEFFALGLGEPIGTTATHGRGVRQLIDTVVAALPPAAPDAAEVAAGDDGAIDTGAEVSDSSDAAPSGVRIAIVGRPNVGKSTLVNRMLGEERVVVYDLPGTTRDSIYIHYERFGRHYTLIDTAGVRRRKNIKLAVEKFSIVKTLQAISDAQVVVLVIDAREGLVDQDLHLLGSVLDAGRALVLAVNKWDGLDPDQKALVKKELERRLRFAEFADLHFISALHGTGVGHLYDSIDKAYTAATQPLSTHRLTRILEDAVADHAPPTVRGRRIKLRYAHAGGHNPPIIVIHGNQVNEVPNHYARYLEKTFRRALGLAGTPVKIEFRGGSNPYAGKKNALTPRQEAKRRRLKKFLKKSKR